jgi:TATA-binding protein-associated factor Taf7
LLNRTRSQLTIAVGIVSISAIAAIFLYGRKKWTDQTRAQISGSNADVLPDLLPDEGNTVEVEDDDGEEDEEEVEEDEEEEKKKREAELKSKFDDVTRMANKLIQGNAYPRAIEKLTEALELGNSFLSQLSRWAS